MTAPTDIIAFAQEAGARHSWATVDTSGPHCVGCSDNILNDTCDVPTLARMVVKMATALQTIEQTSDDSASRAIAASARKEAAHDDR